MTACPLLLLTVCLRCRHRGSCPADPSLSATTNPIRRSRSGGGMTPRPAPKGGEVRHHHLVSRTRPREATPTDLPSSRWPPAQNTRPPPVAIHGRRDLANLPAMSTHRPITFLSHAAPIRHHQDGRPPRTNVQNTRPPPVTIHGRRDLANLPAMNSHRPITFLCRSV